MVRGPVLVLLSLTGCQLVLGFEDHELGPVGADGGGGASTVSAGGGGSSSAQMSGGGGQASGVTFGVAEPVGTAPDPLTDLVVDADKIFALSPASAELLVFTEGQGAAMTVLGGLDSPRGLALDGGQLYTTAADGSSCRLVATSPNGNDMTVISESSASNCYVAVAAEGSKQVASKGTEIRSEAGAGDGTLIGKAFNGSDVSAVALSGGRYFWVDTVSGALLRSDGATVQPQHNPPGNQVDTVAIMTQPVDLAVRAGQVFVVGESGVGRVSESATNGQFVILTAVAENPRGISVDATHVYWVDGPSVRAVEVGVEGAQPTVLYQGADVPSDTYSRGDAIFFTTQAGSVFRVVKTID